ncbi:hypothetical protein D9756_008417 [Leucocoprinus leucothites]|uniref:G domain-containing protein n=1 Tax=Leucocoprinus leucothites TaxID=201217 RepID=A0A8H5D031_9AGAR|nr:hypothetical protein D9756_008417 [Leucoagaricus leucothites]
MPKLPGFHQSSTPKNRDNTGRWVESGFFERKWEEISGVETVPNTRSLNKEDLIIAIMGPTGAGKSTASTVTKEFGYDAGEVGHTLHSTTSRVSALRIKFSDNINVVLVDTPGFDDTNRSDLDILGTIANWFKAIPDGEGALSGIVYLHRITDPRMTSTVVKNFEMFQRLCGKHFCKKVVLATTMWPDVKSQQPEGNASPTTMDSSLSNPPELVARERDLIKNYWDPMIQMGSTHFRFRRTQETAWIIFNHLFRIQSEDRWAHLVRIQEELVEQKKDIPKTEAGQRLHGLMQEVVATQAKVISQLKEELLKSVNQDPTVVSALLEELKSLREARKAAKRDMDVLDPSILKDIRRLITNLRNRLGSNTPKSPIKGSGDGAEESPLRVTHQAPDCADPQGQ